MPVLSLPASQHPNPNLDILSVCGMYQNEGVKPWGSGFGTQSSFSAAFQIWFCNLALNYISCKVETILKKCRSFLSHTEYSEHWAFNTPLVFAPFFLPHRILRAFSCSCIWQQMKFLQGSAFWGREKQALSLTLVLLWSSPARAVESALSRVTPATWRNHRGPFTNLNPEKHPLSEF